MNENGKSSSLPGDNPIRDQEDDILERTAVADAFAQRILDLDASEGAAVGVFGPWGSGKTSFINLARRTFKCKGVPVLDFNPWLFSGVEQLVERFFAELSASMGMRNELKEIGEAFAKYGAAFNAVAGVASSLLAVPQIGAIVKAIAETAGNASQPDSIGALRKKIDGALRKRDKPIVIVLDDVDRLTAPEIREVFKLVRLTASFPNLIYIVSCDRLRVERALEEKEQGLPGRDYLEKIIQWSFNLPEIPRHLIERQLSEAIENALAGIQDPGPFDEDVWGDVYRGILRPLIRNMRDVRRYAIAIRATVGGLEGQVARADVLALEAVRMFLPDIFRLLPSAIDGLTVMSPTVEKRFDRMMLISGDPRSGLNEWLKAQVDGLIAATEKDLEFEAARTAKDVVEAMLDYLFPVGARLRRMSDGPSELYMNDDAAEHLRERRVAHEQIFRRYLEHSTSPELLAFHDAERALARMANRHGLNEFIRSFEPTRRQAVVSNLCNLADQFRPEHVEPGAIVLLDLLPVMQMRLSTPSARGSDAGGSALRATLQLLGVLDDAADVEAAVRRILPEVKSLGSKAKFVHLLTLPSEPGNGLVSKTAANEFKKMLRNEIQAAPANKLEDERDPYAALTFARRHGGTTDEPFEIDASPKLTFALLRSVRGELETGSIDGHAVHRSPALGWESLIALYGSKEVLSARINELKSEFDTLKPWFETREIPLDEAEQVLDLAVQYLSGWRPEAD